MKHDARASKVALLLVVVLVGAACGSRLSSDHMSKEQRLLERVASGAVVPDDGGGGSSGDSGNTAGGESDPGVTDKEIRVGLTGPLGGLAGEILGEEAVGALDSYFQMVNAAGGVNGRLLKLIAYDNAADFSKDATNARKLYEQDKVIAIATTLPDAVADYVTQIGMPTFALGLSASAFSSKFPTVYPILQSNVSATYSVVKGFQQAGIKTEGMRVGITYDTELIDIGPYISYAKDAWETVGSKVVTADPFNFSSGDCTPLVLKMRELQIDWWDFEGLSWVLCVSAAQRLKYQPKVGWGNWPTNIGALAQQAGPWVDGVWFMAPADEPDGRPRGKTAEHDLYVKTIGKYHPRLSSPIHINSVVTQTYWMVGKVLVAALEAQGKVITTEGLNKWFQSVKNFETGISPPIESWAPKCKVGVNTVWIGQWRWRDGIPVREGKTGYLSNPIAEEKYGKCFVTELADKVVKG